MGGYFGDFLGGFAEGAAKVVDAHRDELIKKQQLQDQAKIETEMYESRMRIAEKLRRQFEEENLDRYEPDLSSAMMVPKNKAGNVLTDRAPRPMTEAEMQEATLGKTKREADMASALTGKKKADYEAVNLEKDGQLERDKTQAQIDADRADIGYKGALGAKARKEADAVPGRTEAATERARAMKEAASEREISARAKAILDADPDVSFEEAMNKARTEWHRAHLRDHQQAFDKDLDPEDRIAGRKLRIRAAMELVR